jgi:hypothetical protein
MRVAIGHLFLGLATAIGLAVLLHASLTGLPEAATPTKKPSSATISSADSPALAPPPSEAFVAARAALTERPLFSPSRRPYAPPPTPAPAIRRPPPTSAPALPKLTEQGWLLSGTIVSERNNTEDRIALLRSVRDGAIKKVKEGDEIQGWRVVQIEPGRLNLRAATQEDELVLPKPDLTTSASSRTANAVRTNSPSPQPRTLPGPQR